MSQVHFTSAEVNGLPSCHFTPWRKVKVRAVPSSLHFHAVASSGRMVSRLCCGMCWSKMHQIVEHRHEGDDDRGGRFLLDRGAGRTVDMRDGQDAAVFLREGRGARQSHRDAEAGDLAPHRLSFPQCAGCFRSEREAARVGG